MTDRGWLPVLLALLLGTALPACGPISVNTVAVSPDGKLAFAVDAELEYSFLPDCQRCDIILTDAAGTSLKRITANGRHNSWATFSPDGKTLLWVEFQVEKKRGTYGDVVTVSDQKLVLYDIPTGEARTLCKDEDLDFLVFPQFSPDGKRVAYLTKKHLKVVRVPDGGMIFSKGRGTDPPEVFGPKGFRWIGNDALFVASGQGLLRGSGGGETDIAVVRLGIVEVGAEKEVKSTWQGNAIIAATFLIPWMSVRQGVVVTPLFEVRLPVSEDGAANAPLQLWVLSADGIRRLTNDTNHYYYPEISPDGQRVAAVSRPMQTKPVGEAGKAVLALWVEYDDFIPAPGDLVLVDMKTGKVDAVKGGEFATHPFWIDDDRLGFVQVDDENDEERIVILNLRDNRRLDLTKALAPRLKALFARERVRARADRGDRP